MNPMTEVVMNPAHGVLDTVVVSGRAHRAARPRPIQGLAGELRVLLLEDSAPDVELTEHAMQESGLEFSTVVVATREAFERELSRRPPHLILSDYSLPGFDGSVALEIAKIKAAQVPFIFVTGVLGEEMAIELLKRGATDYVLKTHLTRLGPAVKRAMREALERRERERAEEKLRSSHEQLRALNSHLQYVREEERTRIAREVHDELGQALTGLKLDLSWLAGRLPGGARLQRRKIKAMSTLIDSTIHAMRRVVTELRPGILDSLGLVAAIEWQANEFQERSGIFCEVRVELKELALDAELTTVCFRIFQETLTNIIRHAKATQVKVNLSHQGDALLLTVRDNGRGISEKEIVDTGSIGLIGMRERAAQVGGEVLFFGLPGEGTTVNMRLPLRTAPAMKGDPS